MYARMSLLLLVCADTLRNEFLAAYGHQHLLTLTHLERAGAQCSQFVQLRPAAQCSTLWLAANVQGWPPAY